jgi:hypothetical protein
MPNNARCKLAKLSGTKRGNIREKKLMNLKQRVRTKISETYIRA